MNEHRPTLRLIRHCVGERADRVLVPEGGLFKRFRCIDPTIELAQTICTGTLWCQLKEAISQ